jgi:hypothetical protein
MDDSSEEREASLALKESQHSSVVKPIKDSTDIKIQRNASAKRYKSNRQHIQILRTLEQPLVSRLPLKPQYVKKQASPKVTAVEISGDK